MSNFLAAAFAGFLLSIGGLFGFGGHAPGEGSATSTMHSEAPLHAASTTPRGILERLFGSSAPEVSGAPMSATSSMGKKPSSDSSTSSGNGSANAVLSWTGDTTAIPLGDNLVSKSAQKGYVYSCQTNFTGGGAQHTGGWVHGSTWNLSEKTQVEGKVYWGEATFSNEVAGAIRKLSGNGLPVDEPTGTFPIAADSAAYQIDRNPNHVGAQTVSYSLPASPTLAKAPSCVPMGAIGYALDGVAIYNALDDGGRDAVAHEVQDLCEGHPQQQSEYHYHGPSSCMPHVNAKDTVVGYLFDGFPLTSLYDANGNLYTDAQLDACHGTTGAYTDEQGKTQNGYHYVLTQEYPYTIGCYMGTPVAQKTSGAGSGAGSKQGSGLSAGAPGSGSAQGQSGTPPAEATAACTGKGSEAACSFQTPSGTLSGTCRTTPDGSFACVPAR